ncbi:uncharacterized protein B0I36DRAFT_73568 [Microdochium trichocladiopsis]|uniref:Uncharacterized protein n=1 Tax=Microdochium trichocladiopsis TaxID=1682393 RepID=A0A9P8YFE4_9PEZI|nr:uncharacterized protein B0I36DRAFT_73568 [Microdochium trichocladiopsis]KAH7037986.1 hypothetical protein B0I36DRAFT_73568 [Microdochium trichocladiopsis]
METRGQIKGHLEGVTEFLPRAAFSAQPDRHTDLFLLFVLSTASTTTTKQILSASGRTASSAKGHTCTRTRLETIRLTHPRVSLNSPRFGFIVVVYPFVTSTPHQISPAIVFAALKAPAFVIRPRSGCFSHTPRHNRHVRLQRPRKERGRNFIRNRLRLRSTNL